MKTWNFISTIFSIRLLYPNHLDSLKQFLEKDTKLKLHPKKIIFRKLDWGIDFLGYIILPYHILPRTKTKRRIFKKLEMKIEDFQNGRISYATFNQSFQSYLGYLKHANSFKVSQELKNRVWFT